MSPTRRVLVTGATGFIGGRLARELLAHGYRVRALVREATRAGGLAALGVELAVGDVTDRPSLDRAMEEVDGVFHLAALYRFGVDASAMRAVNVEGTRNVLDTAAVLGRRVLYCGSDTSLGDTCGRLCDETKEHDGRFRSAYEATKHEAHGLALTRMAAGEPVVNAIVSTVYGPGDPSIIGEILAHHLAGRLIVLLDGEAGYTFAHVDDVAAALRLAFERGRSGESYLISGTPATFAELGGHLSEATGIPPPRRIVPAWLLPLVVRLGPLAGKSRAEMAELVAMGRGVTRFFSGDKARRELGWQPRSLRTGLAETLAWQAEVGRPRAVRTLRRGRALLASLALFDIVLGGLAVAWPDIYVAWLHPQFAALHPAGPHYWLLRTGVLWLFFAAVEIFAAAAPDRRPLAVFAVGVLRLMDVPADLAYFAASDDLGGFGRFGLLFSPVFNLGAGAFLAAAGARGARLRGCLRPGG